MLNPKLRSAQIPGPLIKPSYKSFTTVGMLSMGESQDNRHTGYVHKSSNYLIYCPRHLNT